MWQDFQISFSSQDTSVLCNYSWIHRPTNSAITATKICPFSPLFWKSTITDCIAKQGDSLVASVLLSPLSQLLVWLFDLRGHPGPVLSLITHYILYAQIQLNKGYYLVRYKRKMQLDVEVSPSAFFYSLEDSSAQSQWGSETTVCCLILWNGFSFVNTRKFCDFAKAKGFIILFWECSDRRTESNTYDPTVQYARVGSKSYLARHSQVGWTKRCVFPLFRLQNIKRPSPRKQIVKQLPSNWYSPLEGKHPYWAFN